MSQALAFLFLLAMAIPVAGQVPRREILPPRAEPVQRGLLEDKLRENRLHLDPHDGALGYDGRIETAREEFSKWSILGPDPDAATVDQNLTDLRGDPAPRVPTGQVAITGDLDPGSATELEAPKTWIELSRASFALGFSQEGVERPKPPKPPEPHPPERLPGESWEDYQRRLKALKDPWNFHPSESNPSHPSESGRLSPGHRSQEAHGKISLLDHQLADLNATHPEAAWWTIAYNPYSENRFRLWDEKGEPTLSGNDPGEMVAQAIEMVGKERLGVVIGFKGFTPKEVQAFSAELNVKQDLHGGYTAWQPILNADGNLLGLYQALGMKVDGVILDQSPKGWWRARTKFSNANRGLWVQTWLSSAQYLKEFVTSLIGLSSRDSNQSAQQMVEKSKRQLMDNHRELTEKDIHMSMREEIEQTHLGEIARRRREAA